jgi:glyoxylase-like metal-dependent hydrolase (beta-lactamase superfamily II)
MEIGIADGVDRQLVETPTKEIVPGVTMVKCGGHFDGSAVLHWNGCLFIADTVLTVPVGLSILPIYEQRL